MGPELQVLKGGIFMAVLITGGAGYIGSVMLRRLMEEGEDVLVMDSLVCGRGNTVPDSVPFYNSSLLDSASLEKVFSENDIDSVIHMAAFSSVGESMNDPLAYFDNNIGSTINLLEAMEKHGTERIVFSSSAAVYGKPLRVPVSENDMTFPVNPYGETKLQCERILEWENSLKDIRYISFRYFNAAGASDDGLSGETKPTHLIPIVLEALINDKTFDLYGTDYDTPDGTCIRDFIHVEDIASAHVLALHYLMGQGDSHVLNLGNSRGYSVMEVIRMAEKITGKKLKIDLRNRRAGDPPVLIADSNKAESILGWKAERSSLEEMVESGLRFIENQR